MHQVAVPLSLFNRAGIHLDAERLDAAQRCFSFYLDGAPVLPERASASYFLDLPDGLVRPVVTLNPRGTLCPFLSALGYWGLTMPRLPTEQLCSVTSPR